MHFLTTITTLALAAGTLAFPTILNTRAGVFAAPPPAAANKTLTLDPTLIPHFSIVAGSGKGVNNVAIPVVCPPSRDAFIAKLTTNVAAGKVLDLSINFNTDAAVKDVNTQKQRATAMIITLQSFTGVFGKGCPAAATPELTKQQTTGVQSP